MAVVTREGAWGRETNDLCICGQLAGGDGVK
jgi:hypothetical protein